MSFSVGFSSSTGGERESRRSLKGAKGSKLSKRKRKYDLRGGRDVRPRTPEVVETKYTTIDTDSFDSDRSYVLINASDCAKDCGEHQSKRVLRSGKRFDTSRRRRNQNAAASCQVTRSKGRSKVDNRHFEEEVGERLVLTAQELLELGIFTNRIVEVRDDYGKILVTGVIQRDGLIKCEGTDGKGGKGRRRLMRYTDFEDHAVGVSHGSRGQNIYFSNGQTLKDFVHAVNSGFVQNFITEDLHRFTGPTMPGESGSGRQARRVDIRRSTLAKATISFCRSFPKLASEQFLTKGPKSHRKQSRISEGCESDSVSHRHHLVDSLTYSNSSKCVFCSKVKGDSPLFKCDACPQAFHAKCFSRFSGLKTLRNGHLSQLNKSDLCCPKCREEQRLEPKSQKAKDLSKKCKQLLGELDQITGGCCLCHIPDFNRGETCNSNTVILCDQCEREFHIGCLKRENMCSLKAIPKGAWFCSPKCKGINQALGKVRQLGCYKIRAARGGGGGSLPKSKGSQIKYTCEVLCGEGKEERARRSLNEALEILQESFAPLPHAVTGADLLPIMAKAQACADHDYTKVHTILLRSNGEPVCACVIRICGQFLAEIPFVATKSSARNRGHCRQMFSVIERLLSDLGVEQYCLPAAAGQAMNTWIKHFGFRVMKAAAFRKAKADFRILLYPGTTLLVKSLMETN